MFFLEDIKFDMFKKLVQTGAIVRAIVTKDTKNKPRSFFDNINNWAKEQGAAGLAYFSIDKEKEVLAKGPIGKFFSSESIKEIMNICNAKEGDSIFSLR